MIDFDREKLRERIRRDAAAALTSGDTARADALISEAEAQGLLSDVALLRAVGAFIHRVESDTLKWVNEALSLDPSFYNAHMWRAYALIEFGQFQRAIESVNDSMSSLVLIGQAILFGYKGLAYERMEQLAEARFCYLRALEDRSNYETAYEGLIRLALRREDWSETSDIGLRMLEIFREQPAALLSGAVSLLTAAQRALESGQEEADKRLTDLARQQLEIAVQKEPTNPRVLYNLACSYARARNSVLAVEYLSRAVTLDANNRDLARTDPDFARIRDDEAFRALMQAK